MTFAIANPASGGGILSGLPIPAAADSDVDSNRNGRIDGTETAVTLTDDEFRRLLAIAEAIETDRPDRTVL